MWDDLIQESRFVTTDFPHQQLPHNGEAQGRQTNFEAQPRSPFRPLQRSVSLPSRWTEQGDYERIMKTRESVVYKL
jgi:hypothetical protein